MSCFNLFVNSPETSIFGQNHCFLCRVHDVGRFRCFGVDKYVCSCWMSGGEQKRTFGGYCNVVGFYEDRFPWFQYDLLYQNDLVNNWVSLLLSIERDIEVVEAREGEVSRIVVDMDMMRHEPCVS